jgi:hypothetical protein
VGGVGEREAAGEDAAVVGNHLAAVERDGEDRPLAGPDLDPAAHRSRVERVVVAVEAEVRLRRDP